MLDEITKYMGCEAFVRFANPFDFPPTTGALI